MDYGTGRGLFSPKSVHLILMFAYLSLKPEESLSYWWWLVLGEIEAQKDGGLFGPYLGSCKFQYNLSLHPPHSITAYSPESQSHTLSQPLFEVPDLSLLTLLVFERNLKHSCLKWNLFLPSVVTLSTISHLGKAPSSIKAPCGNPGSIRTLSPVWSGLLSCPYSTCSMALKLACPSPSRLCHIQTFIASSPSPLLESPCWSLPWSECFRAPQPPNHILKS